MKDAGFWGLLLRPKFDAYDETSVGGILDQMPAQLKLLALFRTPHLSQKGLDRVKLLKHLEWFSYDAGPEAPGLNFDLAPKVAGELTSMDFFKNLRCLSLLRTKSTPIFLSALASLGDKSKLERLLIYKFPLSLGDCEAIGRLPHLRTLSLQAAVPLNDSDGHFLAALKAPKLEKLCMDPGYLSEEITNRIIAKKSLREIRLRGSATVAEPFIQRLRQSGRKISSIEGFDSGFNPWSEDATSDLKD